MKDVDLWLDARRPRPPADLAVGLRPAVGEGESLVAALTSAGIGRLDEARQRPGRVRESAFRLLEADALLTYACEAALESDDPASAMQGILAAAGR